MILMIFGYDGNKSWIYKVDKTMIISFVKVEFIGAKGFRWSLSPYMSNMVRKIPNTMLLHFSKGLTFSVNT